MPDAIRNPSDHRGTGSSLRASQRTWSCCGSYGTLRGKLVMSEFVLTGVTANAQLASGARHKTTGRLAPFEKEYFRRDGSRVRVLIGVATLEESGNQGCSI